MSAPSAKLLLLMLLLGGLTRGTLVKSCLGAAGGWTPLFHLSNYGSVSARLGVSVLLPAVRVRLFLPEPR